MNKNRRFMIEASRLRLQLAASCIAVVTVAAFAGCETIQNNPRAAKGTVYGAAGGAGAGAAIGAVVDGKKGAGTGAAIGAVVGALGGGLIGTYMDRQAGEMQSVLSEQDRLNREQQKLEVVMASDTMFESGQATLQPGSRDKLARVAQVFNRYPETRIEVIGHTDDRGSAALNADLSERRAQAVADALVANGVNGGRIYTRGEGATRPIASNASTTGRAANRRVEIEVVPDDSLRDSAGASPAEPR